MKSIKNRQIAGKVRLGDSNFTIVGPHERPSSAPTSDNIMDHIAWAINGGGTTRAKSGKNRERVSRWSVFVTGPDREWHTALQVRGRKVRNASLSTMHSTIRKQIMDTLATYRPTRLFIADTLTPTLAEIDLSE